MARKKSVSLGPHFDQFIASQIHSGRYESASEVVTAGLRLLEKHETQLAQLRQYLDEGEQSGLSDYSYESIISQLNEDAE